MRLLVVKTSSLGDVVHTLVPITDARRAVPQLVCDWLVEGAYADVPRWHPGVRRVIPCALRRWRRAPLRARRSGEWAGFREALRAEAYDLVLDAQGLLKSAFLAVQARGPVAGRSFGSAREGLAALFYRHRIPVSLAQTEVEQLRELFAVALGYEPPREPADFGLERARFAPAAESRTVLLLHGAGWPSKLWPEAHWVAVARALAARGLTVQLPGGSDEERARAQRIAAACGGEALPPLSLGELAPRLATARFVVGLDTGLTHLALALGTPTVTLYGPSVPVLERVARGALVNLTSTDSTVVDTRRPNTVPLAAVLRAVERWW